MRRALFAVMTWLCLSLPAFAQDALPDPNCPDAPAPRLVIGERGRVSSGQSNNIRDQAGLSGARIGQIPGEQEFAVLEGPVCLDGFNWWRVDYNGLIGWMVEGQGNTYWTSPVVLDATVAVIDNPYLTPEHAVANQLVTGAQVRVQTADGTALALSAAPGAAAGSDALEDGATVTLLEGAGGWWRVEAEDGLTGWLPEGMMTGNPSRFLPIIAPLCPHTENRLAFIVDDGQTGENLYTIGDDARRLCNLTYGVLSDYESFDWSPDGRALVFSASLTGGNPCQAQACPSAVYTISVDGRDLRRLGDGAGISNVAWSPNGTQIAFFQQGDAANTSDLRVISADGSADVLVPMPDEILYSLVRWSPDGTHIAMVATIDPAGGSDFHQVIMRVALESGAVETLFTSDWRVQSLDWSPDGQSLAASVYIDVGRNVLAEIDAESGQFEVLYSEENAGAAYSPDGTQLAFWRSDMQAPRWVERLDLATGEVTRLATLPGVNGRGASWTADSAYVLVDSGGVLRIDAATGELRSLFLGAVGLGQRAIQVQPAG
ncbi:MAG: PD40 domain-containing protein [Pleurocapsa minor GSE-CHR-MK-17-07R]|jgi:Tol biopolymer transport system component|nr:PD40 domain-containing protein [Pleurocapsa minor GSE-CHR-MK 17-07R]